MSEESTIVGDPAEATEPGPIAPRAALSQGSVVGRYVILEEVGRGAMGAVYSAYDPRLDRRVAIKVMLSRKSDAVALARLLREAQALARLSHPNVVAVYDVGQLGRDGFVAMEFVDGETFRRWQTKGRRPWREVLAVYRQAGLGLAAAHSAGLVHRDFKPDNAMIGADGRVRVMDLGLARVDPSFASEDAIETLENDTLTHSGAVVGTPAYMAPEQFTGGVIGAHSDQFSFCVALYEALVGERPFGAKTRQHLASAVAAGRMRPLPDGVSVPRWLLAILRTGLSPRPEARFESMEALLRAITRARRRRRVAAISGFAAAAAVPLALIPWRGVPGRECAKATDSIRDSWNATREGALEAALVNTGHRDASLIWSRAREPIDIFVAAWTAEYDHLCGSWKESVVPAVLAMRRDCLNAQRRHFDGLIDALSNPTGTTIQFAAAAARALPAPSDCGEIDSTGDAVLPQWVDEVQRAEELIAEARALWDTGDRTGSAAVVDDAIQLLEGVDAPRTQARAYAFRALQLYFDGRAADGEAAETRALAFRAATGDTKFIAAGWLVRLTNLNTHHAEQLDRQQHLLEAVELAVLAAGNDAEQVARLSFVRGMVALDGSHFDEAREHFERAIEIGEDADIAPGRLAAFNSNLGRVYGFLGRIDEASEREKSALKLVRDAYGPAHPTVLLYLSNLGTYCFHATKTECAREYYEEAKGILDAAGDGASRPRVDNLGHLASVEAWQGNDAAARAYAEEGLAMLRVMGSEDTIDSTPVRDVLYKLERDAGNKEAALAMAQELDRIFMAARPPGHPESINGAGRVAEALQALGRYDEALAANQRQLDVELATVGPGHRSMGIALGNRALILEAAGDVPAALEHLKRAHAILADPINDGQQRHLVAFKLAQVLWQVEGPSEEARRLARAAQRGVEKSGPGLESDLKEIKAWLSEHGGPTPAD